MKDLRLAALRRFAIAITILNVLGHTVLGFEQAWIVVRAAGDPGGFIAVAGAGTDPDLIGQRVHASGLGAVAAAPSSSRLRFIDFA